MRRKCVKIYIIYFLLKFILIHIYEALSSHKKLHETTKPNGNVLGTEKNILTIIIILSSKWHTASDKFNISW
jgi:hypothetical protein